jgi:hypothetical protein
MKQRTLAMMTGFERYTKKTKRALFLEEMEQVAPWDKLCSLIEPYYAKAGNGRQPVGLERSGVSRTEGCHSCMCPAGAGLYASALSL